MHYKSDHEVNSNANVKANLNTNTNANANASNIIVSAKPTLNGYATTTPPTATTAAATAAATTADTSTSSSIGSCTSSTSTDSGVIINDNKITWNDNSKNNSKNNSNNNNNHSCNGSIGVTITTDNSDEEVSPPTRPQNMSFNRNINVSNQNDNSNSNSNSNINIENIINITKSMQKQQQQQQINGDIISGGVGANNRRERNNTNSSSKRCSPSVSIRSTTISIVSIDENACDSSIIDSDSDYEPDGEGVHGNYIVKKLGQQTTFEPDSPNLPNLNKGLQVVSQKISPGALPKRPGAPLPETILNAGSLCPPGLGPPMAPSTPQIGSIALSNSTDVTFGDKHFYEGPVTIQQFLIDSRDKWKANEGSDGQDNATFTYERDGKPGSSDDPTKSNQPPPTLSEQPFKFIFNRRAVVITGTIIVLTILIGILIVTTNVFAKQTIRKKPLQDTDYVFNGTLLMVSKDEWHAMAERDGLEKLNTPVNRVIISHTATTICETKHDCDTHVQSVQSFHMDSNRWSDIGYNFLIGGDGLVYEGRGWYIQGAHTKGYNRDSVGISFIGTFIEEVPTQNELLALQLLIDEGIKINAIAPNYRLYGARQLGGTESPGKALYDIIRKWPHWTRQI